jgi:hypothetical protein
VSKKTGSGPPPPPPPPDDSPLLASDEAFPSEETSDALGEALVSVLDSGATQLLSTALLSGLSEGSADWSWAYDSGGAAVNAGNPSEESQSLEDLWNTYEGKSIDTSQELAGNAPITTGDAANTFAPTINVPGSGQFTVQYGGVGNDGIPTIILTAAGPSSPEQPTGTPSGTQTPQPAPDGAPTISSPTPTPQPGSTSAPYDPAAPDPSTRGILQGDPGQDDTQADRQIPAGVLEPKFLPELARVLIQVWNIFGGEPDLEHNPETPPDPEYSPKMPELPDPLAPGPPPPELPSIPAEPDALRPSPELGLSEAEADLWEDAVRYEAEVSEILDSVAALAKGALEIFPPVIQTDSIRNLTGESSLDY